MLKRNTPPNTTTTTKRKRQLEIRKQNPPKKRQQRNGFFRDFKTIKRSSAQTFGDMLEAAQKDRTKKLLEAIRTNDKSLFDTYLDMDMSTYDDGPDRRYLFFGRINDCEKALLYLCLQTSRDLDMARKVLHYGASKALNNQIVYNRYALYTPLTFLCSFVRLDQEPSSRVELIELFLENGADVDEVGEYTGKSAFEIVNVDYFTDPLYARIPVKLRECIREKINSAKDEKESLYLLK